MSGRPPNPNSYQGNHSGGQRYPGQRQREPTHPWERHQSRGQNWQGWNQSYGPDGGYQGYGPGRPQGPYPQYGPPGQNQAPGFMGQRPPDALPQHSGWNQSYRPDGQYQGYGPGGPQGPYPQCGPPGQNQAPGFMSQGPPDALPQHAGWNQAYRPDGQNQGYGPGGPQGPYTQYGPPGQNQATGIMGQGPPAPLVRTYSSSPVIALKNMNTDVEYSFLNETSPFKVLVCFGGQEFKGVATTKKAAKEEAAKQAMTQYYDMHYVPGQDKKDTKAKANQQDSQEEKKENISKKENQGKKKERKTSEESPEESNQKNVDNLLSALSQLAGAKSEIPELGGFIADIRKDEGEPKEAQGQKKTRRGKREKKGGNKSGNNDDDDDNGDDTDLISGETMREGSARGGRENGRGKGCDSRGRDCGQVREGRSQHRSGDQGQNEDDDEDDSEEDDDSDTGSVHSAVYQRSMGSGLNIASPNKGDRQFSSTDNISNAERGRGRRGHRGQGQGRGRGGNGNMNRNTAEIESCRDEVEDLGLDENEVFEFVVKECGGMVKLSNLVDKCQLFPSGSDEARIGQWFKTHRRRFHVFQDGQEVIYVAPFFKDATYCLDYTRKQCKRENCDHFHICQHYMRGTCRKGDTCPKSHSFTDDHNLEQKTKLGLDGFSEIDMCIILLNRYPQICPKRYCKGDKRCPYLHICQRFISKNCKFGEKCSKGHSFDTEHNAWILNRIYHMEKWDKSEGSTFRNIISFPRRLRRRSRHGSGSSKRDDMDSLAGNLSDMPVESDDEPVKPDLLSRTRKDRFKSTEQLHDTEYLLAVEVNIDEETTSEGQRKKTRKKKGRTTESRGSDMSEEEVFDASAKNRNGKDCDKSDEGGAKRKDKNRREQGNSDKSKNKDKESKERAKIYLDDADKTYICYNNVAGTCHNVNNCRFHHKTYGLPYLWQVKLMGKWRTFSQEENEIIERGFCNKLQKKGGDLQQDSKVSIEATEYKLHVCLDTDLNAVVYEVASFPVQKAEHVPVRRLSTPSYAEKRANKPQHGVKRKGPTKEEEGQTGTFCTQWRWYFMDDHNRWTLFDKDEMQFTLEKKFMCNQKTYLFTRQDYNFKYKIDFDKMEQINLDSGKRRRLLRRPLFVSRIDVSAKKFPECLSITNTLGTPDTSHWAPLDMSGAEFELVELERTKEFNRVQDSFYATLDRQIYEIDLIYRVQNRRLWNEYFMKKKMMNEKAESGASGQTVDERDLFHGTDSLETCRKICTNSFDFRISGKNATKYGEGSYFALESDYSNRYTNKTAGSRLMFRAKVLVGNYTKGESSYKRPPEIPGGSNKLYDSCVNDTANPTIFIIFDTSQCYPEYLIQYHKKGEMLVGDVYVPPQPRPASVSSFSNTASSSNNASVSSPPVVPPRIDGVSNNVSSPSAAFSYPYGQVPTVSQSGVRTQASYSQGPVGQSAMQIQAHSQGPVSQSAVSTQPYSQDNSQFHGSPLDYQNDFFSRSAAEVARHTPTQTYRTASGEEVPTPSYRRKVDGCVLQ